MLKLQEKRCPEIASRLCSVKNFELCHKNRNISRNLFHRSVYKQIHNRTIVLCDKHVVS